MAELEFAGFVTAPLSVLASMPPSLLVWPSSSQADAGPTGSGAPPLTGQGVDSVAPPLAAPSQVPAPVVCALEQGFIEAGPPVPAATDGMEPPAVPAPPNQLPPDAAPDIIMAPVEADLADSATTEPESDSEESSSDSSPWFGWRGRGRGRRPALATSLRGRGAARAPGTAARARRTPCHRDDSAVDLISNEQLLEELMDATQSALAGEGQVHDPLRPAPWAMAALRRRAQTPPS